MRVIAGSARRLLLETIDSDETRPTTDRIKETLFNIIQFDVPGVDFLDLFAGSGAVGIEALSRGARRAVFCDSNPAAAACIERNVEHTHFTDSSMIIKGDFMTALTKLRDRGYHFGIVFLDPPYNHQLERRAMQLIRDMDYVGDDTIFIIEADLNDDLSDIEDYGYEMTRSKEYKTNKHVFFRRRK